MARPSKKEIAQRAAEAEAEAVALKARQVRAKRYERQEAKRAEKIQIDQTLVQRLWLAGVGVGFLASAVISFNGITAVSVFVGLSADWMQYLFFFFIEFMYLIFLVAYLMLASQVDDETGRPVSTWGALVGMIFFAGVGIYGNFIHTGIYNSWDWSKVETFTGLILSVSAPIAVISASKLASRVVFAKAITRG